MSDDAIASLKEIAGCDTPTAKHVLEATGNDVEAAATMLLDGKAEDDSAPAPARAPSARSAAAEAALARLEGRAPPSAASASQQAGASSSRAAPRASAGGRPVSAARFAGLSDFARDEDDEDDDHNEYYAGGEKRCVWLSRSGPASALALQDRAPNRVGALHQGAGVWRGGGAEGSWRGSGASGGGGSEKRQHGRILGATDRLGANDRAASRSRGRMGENSRAESCCSVLKHAVAC